MWALPLLAPSVPPPPPDSLPAQMHAESLDGHTITEAEMASAFNPIMCMNNGQALGDWQ